MTNMIGLQINHLFKVSIIYSSDLNYVRSQVQFNVQSRFYIDFTAEFTTEFNKKKRQEQF